MGKKSKQSQSVYNKMAKRYDSAPEGNYTRPHKAELIKKIALKDGNNILDIYSRTVFLASGAVACKYGDISVFQNR